MIRYSRHCLALFKLYVADVFAYKSAALIWILGDLQVTLIMPIVWRAAGGVAGLALDHIATYYVIVMTISQFATSHIMWDIAWDIREGSVVVQLVRPISFFTVCLVRNFAWRVGKLVLFLPFLGLLLPLYGLPNLTDLHPTWQFWTSLLLGTGLSFLAAYALALLALWTTETVSIFQVYYFPELLLSGRVLPLSALPKWAQTASDFLPFKYTVGFPARVLMGTAGQSEFLWGVVAQTAWGVAFFALGRLMLKRGLRQYAGFGL
ncbi:MAG: ABC-2 family transporter protein [Armatimonadetes bacterium]|nr:ABC-2 family transporter protein [Armatimonadota bacterium]